mmetsp:Transcript_35741/g.54970  ORF Transcript_35741/g.54970 Transcript_35741/m.54970 type:complete len:306 (-) Transcript_35741:26-943(-)
MSEEDNTNHVKDGDGPDEQTSLVPKKEEEQMIVKTIDGSSFSLPPSKRRSFDFFKNFFVRPLTIVAAPLWIPALGCFSLLMHFQPIRDFFLSNFLPRGMQYVARTFHRQRRELLRGVSGKVLDVGSGGGAYFQYFSNASHVVALEPMTALHHTIRKAAQEANLDLDSQLTLLPLCLEEYYEEHPKEKFDWIILGNVLCEVYDQEEALEIVDELLHPEGWLYFSEHVGRPKDTLARRFQDMVNPWYRIIGGGCNCNRDTMEQFHAMKGWDVVEWQYDDIQVVFGPFVLGLAKRKQYRLFEMDIAYR